MERKSEMEISVEEAGEEAKEEEEEKEERKRGRRGRRDAILFSISGERGKSEVKELAAL